MGLLMMTSQRQRGEDVADGISFTDLWTELCGSAWDACRALEEGTLFGILLVETWRGEELGFLHNHDGGD
jgi:hypothetical protein